MAPAARAPNAAVLTPVPTATAAESSLAVDERAQPAALMPVLPAAVDPNAAPPAMLPAFELEPPYAPGHVPRPTGKIAASTFDEELARWNLGGASDPAHPSNRANYHPAPRVLVELGALSRRVPKRAQHAKALSEATLLAEARNHGYWPFRTCFERGLRSKPELAGRTRLRMTLVAGGRVSASRVLGTELDRATAACLARAARELVFRRGPTRRLDVDLSVQLWPGDAPLPPRSEGRGTTELEMRALLPAFEAVSPALARCCSEALARDAKLWGRLAFHIQGSGEGAVSRVSETESRFADREASACMARELGAARLPTRGQAFEVMFAARCGRPPQPLAPPLPPAPEVAPAPGSPPVPVSPPAPPPPAPPAPQDGITTSGGSAVKSGVPQ
jgi:hypothetical protein